jgi:hypothetical protein
VANESTRITLILEMAADDLAARFGFEPPGVRAVRLQERHHPCALR